ncbi:uncharacterized protein B0H64DRAFT_383281 [Chaetomium fimeti]|uniref:Uncharacterized protein n=1 Tax=Chaetomium fimeti TaxID=1854472 RepID=A0AAE0HRE9_9PEZI|nr:hypothetical protein B0H64DRAFT_383281 [Chaetomium fimeti]
MRLVFWVPGNGGCLGFLAGIGLACEGNGGRLPGGAGATLVRLRGRLLLEGGLFMVVAWRCTTSLGYLSFHPPALDENRNG